MIFVNSSGAPIGGIGFSIRMALGGSLASIAMTASAQAPASQTDTAYAGIQELVVTAQRREQVLSEVGVSVAVVDGESLVSRGIASTSDLAKVVPGFTAGDSSLNVPVYSLRGVGINESTLSANSTVAIATNEVPLPYTAMTQGAVLDLARVEVLKGPQGTLYGLNATGGAINYVPNAPTQSLEAGVTMGYGRFNTFTGEGFVSGPITETLSARLAVSSIQGDEWQKSYTRNDELGQTDKTSARLLLNWQLTDAFSADIMASGWIDKSDTAASQAIAFRPQAPARFSLIPQTSAEPLLPSEDARLANWTPGLDYRRDDDFYQLALKLSYDITDNLQLLTTSAFSRFTQDALVDRDGIQTVNYHARQIGKIVSRYQEIRLAAYGDRLTWSAGANYRSDDVNDDAITFTGDSTINAAFGFPIPVNGINTDQEIKAYAFFADGEYQLTDTLSAVGGVRYTRDKRDFVGCTDDVGGGDTARAFTAIANFFRAQAGLGPRDVSPSGECASLSPAPEYLAGPTVNTLDEDNVAFRVGLNYRPADRTLIYGSFSRGYKAGSFPALGATFELGFDPAVQERLDAFELGVKSAFLANTLQLNGAAFYYDYQDKQLRGRLADPVLGSLSKLINIPKSEVYGAEIEAAWAPSHALSFYGSVMYVETEIRDYVGIDLFNQTHDFKGEALNYTPKWSVNAGTEYEWTLSSDWKAFAGGDLTYRSDTSGFLGDDPPMKIDSYTTIDLRVGLASIDESWRFSLYGNNVTDEYYFTSTNRGSDTIFRYAGRPRTYGVLASWRF